MPIALFVEPLVSGRYNIQKDQSFLTTDTRVRLRSPERERGKNGDISHRRDHTKDIERTTG